jgi:hypothetical protein
MKSMHLLQSLSKTGSNVDSDWSRCMLLFDDYLDYLRYIVELERVALDGEMVLYVILVL